MSLEVGGVFDGAVAVCAYVDMFWCAYGNMFFQIRLGFEFFGTCGTNEFFILFLLFPFTSSNVQIKS